MTSDKARNLIDEAAERAVSRDPTARRAAWAALGLLLASLTVFALYFGVRYASLRGHAEQQDRQQNDGGEHPADVSCQVLAHVLPVSLF